MDIINRREACKSRQRLGYCNVSDEDCFNCKAYEYEPLDLICGISWEKIQEIQSKKAQHKEFC